jgi:hypothetical protein
MPEVSLTAATERVPLTRIAAAVGGVAGAALGVHTLAQSPRIGPVAGQAVGAALLVAGALAFGWAVPASDPSPLEPPAEPDASRARFDRKSILGVLLPFAASAFAVARFLTKREDALVVVAWAAGILGLLAGQWRTRARPAPSGQRPIHLALLFALLAVALASRLYRLDTLPYNLDGDFASHGLQARELATAADPKIFTFGWAVIPMIGFLPSALTMKLFGTGLVGLAMAGVIEGLLVIVCGYLLGRDLYGPRAGVLTAALLTISYTLLHFSRTSEYIDPVFFTAWAVYFLVRALRWGSGFAAVGAGVMTAFALLMYYSGRIIVFVAAGLVLAMLVKSLAWTRARAKELTLSAVAGLMTLGPMAPLMIAKPHDVMARTRDVFIFRPECMTHMKGVYQVDTPAEVLVQQARRAALLFFTYTDASTQFGCRRAFLDELSGTALVLGLGVVLMNRRRLGTTLPILWIVSILGLGCALTINAPFYPRLVALVVPACLLGGLGLERAYVFCRGLLARRGPPVSSLVPAAALALVLAAAGLAGWRWYLHDYGSWTTGTARLGRWLAAHPGFHPRSVAIPDWWANNRDVEFLAPGALIGDVDEAAVVKGELDPSVPLVISPHKTGALAALHRRFPDASFETVAGNAPGEVAFIVFRPR